MKREIKVNGTWCKVSEWIFRSWAGARRIDGKPYTGPVFYLGSNAEVDRRAEARRAIEVLAARGDAITKGGA